MVARLRQVWKHLWPHRSGNRLLPDLLRLHVLWIHYLLLVDLQVVLLWMELVPHTPLREGLE